MKKLLVRTLFIFFGLLVGTKVFAQATASNQPSAPPAATMAASAAEIAALRAQIETTKQFQDSFMSMAQWTLGTAAAVALALGAFAWYTNKSNYERDRESLARDAKSLATELRAEIQKESAESSKLLLETLAIREKAITDATAKMLDNRVAGLKSHIKDIENELHELQETDLQREAQDWIQKGVQSNALSVLAELLVHQIKRDSGDYFLSQTLEQIMNLSKDSSKKISADTFSAVSEAIEKLPKGFRGACDPIIANLKRKLG